MSIPIKCTLVLPKFRTLAKDIHNITINHNKDHKYYQWCDFYDVENIRKKYNIITIDEFKKLDLSIDLLFSRGNDFINHNKILISGIEFDFLNRKNIQNNDFNNSYKNNNIIAICGTTNQLPFNKNNYMTIRNNIRYNNYFYEEINNYLKLNKIGNYIAIHWRQTDFLSVRRNTKGVLNTEFELVEKIKKIIIERNINKIYISTDSKDYNKIKYLNDNLPLFFFKTKNLKFKEKYIFAVIESIICAKANYFYGTKTSLFSVNIFAERQVMGFDSEQQFI